jgi:hypothetical protein
VKRWSEKRKKHGRSSIKKPHNKQSFDAESLTPICCDCASEKVGMNCTRIRRLFVGTLQTIVILKLPRVGTIRSSFQGEAKAYGSRKFLA